MQGPGLALARVPGRGAPGGSGRRPGRRRIHTYDSNFIAKYRVSGFSLRQTTASMQ